MKPSKGGLEPRKGLHKARGGALLRTAGTVGAAGTAVTVRTLGAVGTIGTAVCVCVCVCVCVEPGFDFGFEL